MLWTASGIKGYAILASDGTIGNIVDDFALYMQAKGAAEAIVSANRHDMGVAAPPPVTLDQFQSAAARAPESAR